MKNSSYSERTISPVIGSIMREQFAQNTPKNCHSMRACYKLAKNLNIYGRVISKVVKSTFFSICSERANNLFRVSQLARISLFLLYSERTFSEVIKSCLFLIIYRGIILTVQQIHGFFVILWEDFFLLVKIVLLGIYIERRKSYKNHSKWDI